MFPVEFDYHLLSTLPLPSASRAASITQILKNIVIGRVIPYFKTKRGTDPIKLARIQDDIAVQRFEDLNSAITIVSLLILSQKKILIHERIFDFLSFVIPSDPDSRLGNGTIEEQKMLAFAELILRHQVEHIVYPERKEREIILSDIDFAMDQRAGNPTFYRMLRNALGDEMNGIRGEHYLALLERSEKKAPLDSELDSILDEATRALSDSPIVHLQDVFPWLDTEMKNRVLEESYRRSHNTGTSLMRRTHSLRAVLRLFTILMEGDEREALEALNCFKDRWGLVEIFRELDLPERALENKSSGELLRLFKSGLLGHRYEDSCLPPFPLEQKARPAEEPRAKREEKSLKDRIEDARNDPAIPSRVIEFIDKNKLNTVGHSGSKYSELIETLLAIPWGKIRKIAVSPQEFEEGLNRTHYGLQTPKELLCDFFTNLIWRYQRFSEAQVATWKRTGSAFLLVGPPGVGKTSLAISVAQNLGIPYHKISLGGMRDEADMRGFGFTYEGSKPGAIVQGLIKMEAMNGMFILDEADKTEKFAIATLLEILDPEQNHLFHDKYTLTTIDIDLSNCHFFLTANSLETVPEVVINRCEVVALDRYSVEEKVDIARKYLLRRIRDKYQIDPAQLYFDPKEEAELLRHLIRSYTYEAGVRELERIIRTLLLRMQRKEILTGDRASVRISREKIKEYLKDPTPPKQISMEDAVGEMLALGVDVERGVGSIIPIQATWIGGETSFANAYPGTLSIVHATGNIERIMDESRKVASTGIFYHAKELGIDLKHADNPVHLHFLGGSSRKDGLSAGGAIALALASLLSGHKVRKDVAMTGEIDTKGRIIGVGALALKTETAFNAGCRTMIIARENLYGERGIERFPEALKKELQILTYEQWAGEHEPFDFGRHILQMVSVDDIVQAADVAFIEEESLRELETHFDSHARKVAGQLRSLSPAAGPRLRIVQLKKPEELDPALFGPPVSMTDSKFVLLTVPGIHDAVRERLRGQPDSFEFVEFDPKRQKLQPIIQDIPAFRYSSSGYRAALIAPYFLLKHDGIVRPLPGESPAGAIRFFANNYTAQKFKIKRSKALLDQVFAVLALLSPPDLEECPFLSSSEGVYVADLSYIPEQYRLDTSRAEKIMHSSLTHWLDTLRSEWG
ncbi:MAG: AAA family ATPase [Desulfobacteraceae bacterium]|nr:AAA family ATPase [Desulfobacteraceae bacterium]